MEFNYTCLTPISEDLLDLLDKCEQHASCNSVSRFDSAFEISCSSEGINPLKYQGCQIVQANVVPTEHKTVSSMGHMENNWLCLPPVSQDLFNLLDQYQTSMDCDPDCSSPCTGVSQDVSNIDIVSAKDKIIPADGTMDHMNISLPPLPEDFFDLLNNFSQSPSSTINDAGNSSLRTSVSHDVSNIGCLLDLEGPGVLQVSPLKEGECIKVQADLVRTEPKNIPSTVKVEPNYCLSPISDEDISEVFDFIDKSLPPQLHSALPEDDRVRANDEKPAVFEADMCDEGMKSSIVLTRKYTPTVLSELTSNSNHFCIMFKQGQSLCFCGEEKYTMMSKYIPIDCRDSLEQHSNNSTSVATTVFIENQDNDTIHFCDEKLGLPSRINVHLPEKHIKEIKSPRTVLDVGSAKSGIVGSNCTNKGVKQAEANVSLKAKNHYLGQYTENGPLSIIKQEVVMESPEKVRSPLSLLPTMPHGKMMRKVTMIKKFLRRKRPKTDAISEVTEVKSQSSSLFVVDKQTMIEYSEGSKTELTIGSNAFVRTMPNHLLSLSSVKQPTDEQVENRTNPIRNSGIAGPSGHTKISKIPSDTEDRLLSFKKRKRSNIITVAGTQKKYKVLCSWNSAIIPKEFLKNPDFSNPLQTSNSKNSNEKDCGTNTIFQLLNC